MSTSTCEYCFGNLYPEESRHMLLCEHHTGDEDKTVAGTITNKIKCKSGSAVNSVKDGLVYVWEYLILWRLPVWCST